MRTSHVTKINFFILLFCFALIPCFMLAQTSDSTSKTGETDYNTLIPQKEGVYMYEDIQKVDSVTKDELYTRAKVWFVQNFKDAKEVLQMDDRQAGRIIGKGFFSFTYPYFIQTYTMRVFFTADITVKDGKYRIQFYDIDPKDEFKDPSTKISSYNSEKIPTMIGYCYKGANKKTYKRKMEGINTGFLVNIKSIDDALNKQTTASSSNGDF